MKCPFCLQNFIENRRIIHLEKDIEGDWGIIADTCPDCKKTFFKLTPVQIMMGIGQEMKYSPINNAILIRPKAISRSSIPSQIPREYAEDYQESCLVLSDSPKASAALSRRCLQHIIEEKVGIKKKNLAEEIQVLLDSKSLPSYIDESLDAVRNIGNFAAHPQKSLSTGEIVPVEAGEAEWNLEVIEMLFDFYFVKPDIAQKKKDAINAKLIDAGRPPIK
jgi:hypothetical protein